MEKSNKILLTIIFLILVLVMMMMIIMIFQYYKNHYDPFPSVSQRISKSIVQITIQPPGTTTLIPLCTGFIVSKEGHVVTAQHCFDGLPHTAETTISDIINMWGHIKIINEYGIEQICKITKIENKDLEIKDVLLLKMTEDKCKQNLQPLEISQKIESKEVGKEIGFIGYTRIDKNNPFLLITSKGIIANKDLNVPNQKSSFYTLNTYSHPGISGGPVFMIDDGKIIGIIATGMSYNFTNSEKLPVGIVIVPPIHEIPSLINT